MRDSALQRCLMKRRKVSCPVTTLSLQVSGLCWRGWDFPHPHEEQLHGALWALSLEHPLCVCHSF